MSRHRPVPPPDPQWVKRMRARGPVLWRIGQVFRRRGQVGSSVACSVLAFVVPICGLMMLAAIGDDPSSLALMTFLPTYPFGAAGVFQWFVRNLPRAWRE